MRLRHHKFLIADICSFFDQKNTVFSSLYCGLYVLAIFLIDAHLSRIGFKKFLMIASLSILLLFSIDAFALFISFLIVIRSLSSLSSRESHSLSL
jgi:hypothetical protein